MSLKSLTYVLNEIFVWIEQKSSNILNVLLSTEDPINAFFNQFWARLADWGFILIATIIAVVVTIRVDRELRKKQKLHGKTLWKTVSSISIETVLCLFFGGFAILIAIVITLGLVELGAKHFPTLTLIILIALLLYWRYKRKKKKRAIYKRLQKGKKAKVKK